jgi:hypothetical protein
MPVTQAPPAVAPLVPGPGTWLVGALMAVDRLVVLTGLLVLLGGAGFVAVARLPTPAWRLTRRVEGRAWWLLRAAWWATALGTFAGLLLHGPFTAGLPLRRTLDPTLLAQTLGTRFGGAWAVRVLLLLLLVAFLRAWSQREDAWTRTGAWVAVFVVLIAVAARSRVLVRRKLTARALAGAAAPHRPARAAALPRLAGDDGDAGSLWLLRRLVLAEITVAIVVLVITALLGIATPPNAA